MPVYGDNCIANMFRGGGGGGAQEAPPTQD